MNRVNLCRCPIFGMPSASSTCVSIIFHFHFDSPGLTGSFWRLESNRAQDRKILNTLVATSYVKLRTLWTIRVQASRCLYSWIPWVPCRINWSVWYGFSVSMRYWSCRAPPTEYGNITGFSFREKWWNAWNPLYGCSTNGPLLYNLRLLSRGPILHREHLKTLLTPTPWVFCPSRLGSRINSESTWGSIRIISAEMLRHVGSGDIPPMPRESVDFQDTFISHKGWEEACSQKVPKLVQEGNRHCCRELVPLTLTILHCNQNCGTVVWLPSVAEVQLNKDRSNGVFAFQFSSKNIFMLLGMLQID